MQSFRIVGFLCRRYTDIFWHFCFFLFDILRTSLRALVSNSLSVIHKTELYGPKSWKYGSWSSFFNAWKSRREIMVSKISIICTILCSYLWFVWNHTIYKRFNAVHSHTLLHVMSSSWYSCMPYSCIYSLWHSCNHTLPYITCCIIAMFFVYGGQAGYLLI